MKKIISFITLGILTFTLFVLHVDAAVIITGTVNSSNGINIRNGAGTNYATYASIGNGYEITLQSTTKYSGTGCSGGWYKITYKNLTKYACSNYIANVKSIDTSKLYNNADWTARINASGFVSFRKSASSSGTLIQKLNYGSNLTILSKTSSTTGCSGYWYQVKYINTTGYVCGNYIYQKSNITSSATTYNTTWANAGFPSSYYPYLTYLKTKYPNATFTAVKTNTNFNDAVLSEYGSNYIQLKDLTLIASTTQVETGGWYKAKNETIAFYLDPRNFLNEKMIFIFEDNKYTASGHTNGVVQSVFDGGSLKSYASSFITSGSSVNISPVHLATRVRQEVGINGNDATKGPYYNFFNIGAISSCANPLQCGLTYAKNSGWDTPVKSITAGANLLKSNYYNNNQKTRYYEKFNVIGGKYSNQYMTNINAPIAEGSTAYEKYVASNVANSNWNFIIPVYNNMPTVTSLSTTAIATTTSTKTAPSKVTGVKSYLAGYDKIKISWSKVSGATSYKVWYRKANTSTWYTLTTTGTSLTTKKLANGRTYFFKVKAYKSGLYSSSYSSQVKTTTMSKVKINSLSKSGSTKIKIKYSEIVGETGYKIYRKTSKSSWSLVTTKN